MIEDPGRRARVAAAVGAVAAVAVPINYMSVYWWRTLHQTPSLSVVQKKSYLNPELSLALLVMVIGFTILYVYMLRYRSQIAAKVAQLEEQDLELELNARNSFRIGEVVR